MLVVDQPASVGALPLTVARDAFIIADAARAMPRTLCALELEDETVAELEMIVGFDDDLAGEATRISNRLRGLLTQIHPSLERVLGPRIQHPSVLLMLDQFGSPDQLRKAGRRRLVNLIRAKAPRMAERLVVVGTHGQARRTRGAADRHHQPRAIHCRSFLLTGTRA